MNLHTLLSALIVVVLAIVSLPLLNPTCKFLLPQSLLFHYIKLYMFKSFDFFFCFFRLVDFEIMVVDTIFNVIFFVCDSGLGGEECGDIHEWWVSPFCWFYGCSQWQDSPPWQFLLCSGSSSFSYYTHYIIK